MRGEEFEPDLAEKIAANDGIIGYTQETTDILRGYASPDTCLTTIQGGYDADLWKPREDDPARDWDSPTTRFGMLGSLNLRKNVWAALEAFNGLKETFGPEFDAELILKANLPGLPPQLNEYPGVTLIYEPWSHRQIRDFYMGLHCLLAPSWGEGKNLPALEAQTLGIPVIATPCSGHMAWANPDFVYLAKSTLVERDPNGRPGQLHHQVDVEGLADKMWEVHTNRQEARRRGEIASRVIPQMCDWSRVVERLGMWLDYDMVPKPR